MMRTKRDSSSDLWKSLLKIKSTLFKSCLALSCISTWLKCYKVTESNVTYECILNSNHIEADTKIALHCSYAVEDEGGHALVRSPSGDVDILVALLQLLSN